MRRIARTVFASGAALALAACGKSDKPGDDIAADTVEMPAEEAMSDVTGMPSDMATDVSGPMEGDMTGTPADTASGAGD